MQSATARDWTNLQAYLHSLLIFYNNNRAHITASLSVIGYTSSYFKSKISTPIRDELANKSLKRLKLEL